MFKKISNSKIIKIKEMLDIIDVLFQNQNLELFVDNQNILEAWLIGDAIRDLYIIENPQIENYTFYFQVKDKNKIFNWIKRLNEKNVNTYIVSQNELIAPNIVYQHFILSLLNYNINTEINIITGELPAEQFIEEYMPINLNMIGLDIGKLFSFNNNYMNIYDEENTKTYSKDDLIFFINNDLSKAVWTNDLFTKGYQNKSIFVLKHDWMKTKNGMEFLEQYLQKTDVKLDSLLIN